MVGEPKMEKTDFNIAIVDDNFGATSETKKKLKTVFELSSFENINFTLQNYPSGNHFLNSEQEYDLVLMDYEMPELNGIETAQKLQIRTTKTKILFLSGYSRPVEPLKQASYIKISVGYLFKDDSIEEFQYVVEQTIKDILAVEYIEIDYFELQRSTDSTKNERIWRKAVIDIKKIVKLLADGKIIHLIMSDGKEFATTMTLEKWRREILNIDFDYANKSCIVNLRYIETITTNEVDLTNDDTVALSKNFKNKLIKNYTDYTWREAVK